MTGTKRGLKHAATAYSEVAVLLIDWQRAFLDGVWAQEFGLEQVGPIVTAATNTAEIFDRGILAPLPIIATRCYLVPPDSEPPKFLYADVAPLPWVWKPTMNVMQADGFAEWMDGRLQHGARVLVIGGCTTTSCVRVSSQAVQRAYAARGLQVVVDLSLCGARTNGHDPLCAAEDTVLAETYGIDVAGRSAVDLAVLQMRRTGVLVVPRWAGWDDLEQTRTAKHSGCGAGVLASAGSPTGIE
jgi:nicotinamidase-related amidase